MDKSHRDRDFGNWVDLNIERIQEEFGRVFNQRQMTVSGFVGKPDGGVKDER